MLQRGFLSSILNKIRIRKKHALEEEGCFGDDFHLISIRNKQGHVLEEERLQRVFSSILKHGLNKKHALEEEGCFRDDSHQFPIINE